MLQFSLLEIIQKNIQTVLDQYEKISGLYGSSLSFFIRELFKQSGKPVVFISSDFDRIFLTAEDLLALEPESTIFFPKLESSPFEFQVAHPEKQSLFQENLIQLNQNKKNIVLVPLETLLLKTIDRNQLKNEYIRIKKNEEIDRDAFIEFLQEFGYHRHEIVEDIGEFAVRGAIIDVFPFQSSVPIRIEFFGDEISSIREFDIVSQLSQKELSEFCFSTHFLSQKKFHTAALFQYFPKDSIIILDEPDIIDAFIIQWQEQIDEYSKQNDSSTYLTLSEFKNFIKQYKKLEYLSLGSGKDSIFTFPFVSPEKFHGSLKLFFQYLKKKYEQNKLKNITIFCENESRREVLTQFIEDELGDEYLVTMPVLNITRGFHCKKDETDYFTEHEIFNRIRQSRVRKKIISSGSIIRKINRLNPGDLVVHVDYGIGYYDGVEKISIAGSPPKDVVKLVYKDNDILYVSLDKINKIQKYVSTKDDYTPDLTKLGSAEWIRIKKKTQKEIEKLAADLIQIYATRMTRQGFAFSEDTLWQRELEALFPYQETPDQIKCIEEVKRDMQSSKPMDRLLCGDVGFGKTEVAIRAAFKAVQDGKQVAVLVPTTLLANQHYYTFSERMKNFPVNIEMLSRFRSRAQQLEILQKLEKGEIDIIIGTHRLLSDDVRFKDLGLLIIDEEQRFGVKHKEKIKKLKATIDILTMSATPIPRTLHMSLIGARDLSQIETPPKNRLPIYTEICNWDDRLIREAILKEVKRGGQVFFVHNRVETIYGIKSRLEEIIPEVKFVVAHGQMREKELEEVMEKFYEKKYDVLIATMIIENGIDIPSCNTIFINDAHRFGLAQLYQLRGRVGRSESQAYAYLIVPALHKLKKESLKKLYALQEFSELGSGIKIAMKDLEIRGAGNILGARQSGHINAIGYDLYVKILNEAVEKIKEASFENAELPESKELIESTVDIAAEIYFPDDYIGSQSEKAFLYYRLGQFSNLESLFQFEKELEDRFGPLPEPAKNLLFLHYLRILGSRNYIQRIQLTEKKLIFTFHEKFLDKKTNFDAFIKHVTSQEGFIVQFKQEKNLKLILKSKIGNLIAENFMNTKKLLQEFMKLHYIK